MQAGWELIRTKIKMDDPTPIGKFLGCGHSKIDLQHKELEEQLKAAVPLTLPANERTNPNGETKTDTDDTSEADSKDERRARSHSRPPENTNNSPNKQVAGIQYEISGFMGQCVERYLVLTGVTVDKLRFATTPGLGDHSFTEEDWLSP